MSPVPAFPSAADAMAAVRAGLRFLAGADATQMPVQTQAECLKMLEEADVSMNLASRSRIRKRKEPVRFPKSITRLRACWAIHAPSGWAVTPGRIHAASSPA